MADEPITDRDRAFIHRYGLSCWSRAIRLYPLKSKRTEQQVERDPDKVYEPTNTERMMRDGLPSPFGFKAEI